MLYVLLVFGQILLASAAIVIGYLLYDRRRLVGQLTMDPLMGIGSRALFELMYASSVAHACRSREPLVVLFIDLNDLKLINSRYGHPGADRILRSFGQLVVKSVRLSDIASRYGGDEVVVILPNTTREKALVLADRLREAVRQERVLLGSGETASFGVSIGGACLEHPAIVIIPEEAKAASLQAAEQLLVRANQAMLAAKLLKGSVDNPILFH